MQTTSRRIVVLCIVSPFNRILMRRVNDNKKGFWSITAEERVFSDNEITDNDSFLEFVASSMLKNICRIDTTDGKHGKLFGTKPAQIEECVHIFPFIYKLKQAVKMRYLSEQEYRLVHWEELYPNIARDIMHSNSEGKEFSKFSIHAIARLHADKLIE